ncbi:lipoyl(octanoyl) transferase LipB [Candidatus Thiosymbion oneisti]|uniref:lipoyl(octanoyl) transferase LipB n=1 Tax=Candidatus Thiosymbion oneisti TaxID=589554 RepID=UPI000A5BC07F|nr:lipoyl(octanoyl) transferase LipB [Candidatus Thiosymbion oneisti]
MTDPREVLIVRRLGLRDYESTWRAMQSFTDRRGADTADELWLLEHPPVYTLGKAGRPKHVIDPGGIPVIATDRGGQVTYHGPGQLVAYILLDLPRAGIGVKRLVQLLEQSVVALLRGYGIASSTRSHAPGVYVEGAKIAAVGLRVRRGCSFHGLALNVNLDLAPFSRIDPCGYPGLAVTAIAQLDAPAKIGPVGTGLAEQIARLLARCIIPV